MMVALKNPEAVSYETENPDMQKLLDKKTYLNLPENTPILTDDYAPVEYLISELAK